MMKSRILIALPLLAATTTTAQTVREDEILHRFEEIETRGGEYSDREPAYLRSDLNVPERRERFTDYNHRWGDHRELRGEFVQEFEQTLERAGVLHRNSVPEEYTATPTTSASSTCEPATKAEIKDFCGAAGLSDKQCGRLDFSCGEPEATEQVASIEHDTASASSGNIPAWQDWLTNEPHNSGGHPGYGEVWDFGDGRNVEVRNGQVVLKVTKCDNPGGKPMCGAEITTRGKMQNFTHGRLEVKAKFDNAAGMWPGIWAMGNGAKWPKDAVEIDLMEVVNNGKDNGNSFTTLHWGEGGCPSGHCQTGGANPPKLDNGWHTYTLDRSASKMTFAIDGKESWSVTPSEAKAKGGGNPSRLFSDPVHIRLSNGSGGAWAGSNQQPGEFVIDRVKISE